MSDDQVATTLLFDHVEALRLMKLLIEKALHVQYNSRRTT